MCKRMLSSALAWVRWQLEGVLGGDLRRHEAPAEEVVGPGEGARALLRGGEGHHEPR